MGRKARAGRNAGVGAHRRTGHGAGHGSSRRKRGSGGTEYSAEDFEGLVEQVKMLGLCVRKMEADGNCLFRTFADQLCGDCEEHSQYREECCDYMLANAEAFEVFHADEDDEESQTFENYVDQMRTTGRWGSQLELMALCQRYTVNAIVHQLGMPAYEMVFAPRDARCLQLSYHDGEHYNSIRSNSDLAPGLPARLFTLQQVRGQCDEDEEREEVQRVRECLPPGHAASSAAVCAALARSGGDPEAAAEILLRADLGEEQGVEPDADQPADSEKAVDIEVNSGAPPACQAREAPRSGGPRSRAEKRQDRKRAKEAAEQHRRQSNNSNVVDDADADLPDDEAIARFSAQLLTV